MRGLVIICRISPGWRFVVAGLAFLAMVMTTPAAEFSRGLDAQLLTLSTGDYTSAIIILQSPIDIQTLDEQLHVRHATKAERKIEVLRALHYNADQTQPAFRAELDEAKARGEVAGYTAYWIENLFVIQATRDYIESLRPRGDISYGTENFRAELMDPIRGPDRESGPPITTLTVPSGIRAVGAYRVCTELGITGQGVLVANLDTGVDGTHPALQARWRGNFAPIGECWRDALGGQPNPTDTYGHGTHVMGTITGRAIVGSDTQWVGCAPDARWIADNAINQNVGSAFDNDVVDAFQWFADPDGNPNTLEDDPDVVQNSWRVNAGFPGYQTCDARWNSVILNCEATGTVITWSAGNEGPGSSTIGTPPNYEFSSTQIFSVGAVDAGGYPNAPYPIASWSSRGPTPCPPNPNAIKPEIVAPGVNVYSSVPGGGYSDGWSGTSMAGPHVAGCVALMRQACPDCDPQTIKEALLSTAIDAGYPPAGEDNTFGMGFIDCYAAVQAVSPPPQGDNCANPFVIPSLPYTVSNTTVGFTNDYDYACPYIGGTAPDVVYAYTPIQTELVSLNLCSATTNFDTKLYVFQNTCINPPIACNDDSCTSPNYPNAPYVSRLDCVPMSAGNTYYIVVDGYATASGNYTLEASVCSPPAPEPFLRVGDWLNPEPWHNWLAGPGGTTHVQLLGAGPASQIDRADFFYSLDGQNWILFGTDFSPYDALDNTHGPLAADTGDGLSGYFSHSLLPSQNVTVYFQGRAYGSMGTIIAENSREFDVTPPSSVTLNVVDWQTVTTDCLLVDLDPLLANLDSVGFFFVPKPDTFSKGVPNVRQRSARRPNGGEMYCAPTAAAACLKWFESQGDTTVAGGLADSTLVDSLAAKMKTDSLNGSSQSDQLKGIKDWLEHHGDGYTARMLDTFNFDTVRKEVERGQDVLQRIIWDGGGGHRMTLNSIVNRPQADGTMRIDFMDPYSGQIEWGNLNTATGHLDGFTSVSGNSGQMGNSIIICPKERRPAGNSRDAWQVGPNPPPIWLNVPGPGLWFLNVIVIDLDDHAHRLIRIVDRILPPVVDLVIVVNGANTVLYWTSVPWATSYRIETADTADGPWSLLGTSAGTSFTHVGGTGSPKLFYRVIAQM